MPGKDSAPKSGKELQNKVVELCKRLALNTKTEVNAARRLWGQKRYIDVVVTHPTTGKTLGIECKFQSTSGTAEEKIPATIQDINSWPIPGIVVIDGQGFSD